MLKLIFKWVPTRVPRKNESSPISSSAASLVESVLTGGPGFFTALCGCEKILCCFFPERGLSVFRAVAGREVEKKGP